MCIAIIRALSVSTVYDIFIPSSIKLVYGGLWYKTDKHHALDPCLFFLSLQNNSNMFM